MLCFLSLAAPAHMSTPDYTYDRLEAAFYSVFSPFAWNIFFAWVIFTAYFGYSSNNIFYVFLTLSIKSLFKTHWLKCSLGGTLK
jgi:hypothetical protein